MTTTNARLERLRERQSAADVVLVRPMYPARRQVPTDAADRLAVVFDLFGLADRERQVIAARLAGATFAAVAAAGRVTRQRAQQVERRALARLGLSGSVEAIAHADQRGEAAVAMHDRAAGVRSAELTDLDAGRQHRSNLTRADRAHEAAVARFLRSRGVTA